jgi:chromosome segregation ATPase
MTADVLLPVSVSGGGLWSLFPRNTDASTNSSDEKSQGCNLKNRVSFHWRMAPGLISLASHIVAIICSLIWHHPGLTGACVPGSLCSVYSVYLGWGYQHLKTFGENNEQLESSLSTLENENQHLRASNETLNQSLEGFREGMETLQKENGTLKTLNTQLSASVEDFKDNINALETARGKLEQELAVEMRQLTILNEGLTGIHESATANHTTFSANLESFNQKCKDIEDAGNELTKTNSEIKKHSSTLAQVVVIIQDTYTQICAWKDDGVIAKQIAVYQNLQQQSTNLQVQLATQAVQLEEQKKQLDELRKLKGEFHELHGSLVTAASELKSNNTTLSQEVEKAAKAFENYGLKT